LPLADAKEAAELWPAGSPPNWVRLLAVFPKAMKGRVGGLKAGMEKGNVSPRLKAEIAWVAARHDRAWYALAVARERLKALGFSEEKMFALDGGREQLPEPERAALALVETMTVSPWEVTDDHVTRLRRHFKDAEVAEIVHHACNAAFFDRVTEAARLSFDH
jgi:alkylhydroperoxidase family enzyme